MTDSKRKRAEEDEGTHESAGAEETIVLRAASVWTGTLSIGEAHYPVQDGVVHVPAYHVAHAHAAGFRPITEGV